MESIYTKLALYGSTNECARTDAVFLPIYGLKCLGKIMAYLMSFFLSLSE